MAFPETALPIVAEIFVDGAWEDITRLDDDTRLLAPDGLDAIVISRGATLSEQVHVSPTTVAFAYLDNNATLDGENVSSPYWRKIGQNTPLRILVDSVEATRVELSTLDPKWDESGSARICTLSVDAAGILRRLEAGRKPLRSTAYRCLTSPNVDDDRVSYWPVEESAGATRVSSPYPTSTVVIAGTVTFGSHTGNPASERMAVIGEGGKLVFPVATYTGGETRITAQVMIPEGLAAETRLARFYCTGGDVSFVDLVVDGNDFLLRLYESTIEGPALLGETFPTTTDLLGTAACLVVGLGQESVTDFSGTLSFNTFPAANGGSSITTIPDIVVGNVTRVQFGGIDAVVGMAVGHVAVGNSVAAFSSYCDVFFTTSGSIAYQNEMAAVRIARLATELDIPYVIVGSVSSDGSMAMGPQGPKRLYELWDEAATADQGMLFDTRDALGITYITQASMINPVPAVTVAYSDLSKPFARKRDGQFIRNDITTTGNTGGTARFVIPDDDPDHFTTQEPGDYWYGVGTYDEGASLSLATDANLDQWAAWYAHLRAWAEKRSTTIRIDLTRGPLVADAAKTAAVRALDIGDVIAVNTADSPAWIETDELLLLIRGYTRSIGQYGDHITLNVTPARPFEVGMIDTGGSTLLVAVDDNDTTYKLGTSVGPEWTNQDEPWYVEIDGDAAKITALVTDTPSFGAAGTASHAVNANTTPGLPAGVASGNLMLLAAAIRNSGTGTVGTNPTGWETLIDYGNVRIMWRYFVTGDTGPTVTYSGGVAGADTSSQIASFPNTSHYFASGTMKTPAAATQLNGSAANIATPALVVIRNGSVGIWFGWRQQDWTSVATLAAATGEIGEPDTGTGDNQGFVWDYVLQVTATDLAADSFVVTGGVNGISRGITFALRPTQTATVERDINNAAASHAAGTSVRVWRPGLNGL